jgi:hypothetical protein
LGEVEGGVGRLAAEDLQLVSDAGLGERIEGLQRTIARLQAELARTLGLFDRRQAFYAEGALSSAAWLRWKCRLAPGQASEQVLLGRQLERLPATAACFAAGEIGFDHARLIAHTSELVGAAAMAGAEPILVEAARQLDPSKLRLVSSRLRHCLDAEGFQREENAAHERRGLYLGQTYGGMFHLEGMLDPEGGVLLRQALEASMGPRRQGDERSPAQRRADALLELLKGGRPAQLTVYASQATLRAEPGCEPGELEGGGGGLRPGRAPAGL